MELEPTMPVPLKMDPYGSIRVGGSRVTLDTLMAFYFQGCTPETIQDRLPTLSLDHIYGTLAYYLNHVGAVDVYLKANLAVEDRVRAEIEARNPPELIRARLLARRSLAS